MTTDPRFSRVKSMKSKDVVIGNIYRAKVSGQKVDVRILRESEYGGWVARNTVTGRDVRIKTAGRLTDMRVYTKELAELLAETREGE